MSVSTTVQIDEETWQRLNARKQTGDTFDDVICRLLEKTDSSEVVEA